MKFSAASLLLSAAFTCMLAGAPAMSADEKGDAATSTPLTKADVEAIVKQVIKDNPEFVMRTLEDYEVKEQATRISKASQNITKLQDKIEHDPRSPSVGNPKGDVTITEFFDYHCGYCKSFFPEIPKLLSQDKNVRIDFKEFPILRDDSANASRAALAVYNIDPSKYFDYHILLMRSTGDFTDEVLTAKAKQLGIDEDVFTKAFHDPALGKDLENNKELASSLAITGTPALLIGNEFMPGAISFDTLKSKVADARDNQKQRSALDKDKKDD